MRAPLVLACFVVTAACGSDAAPPSTNAPTELTPSAPLRTLTPAQGDAATASAARAPAAADTATAQTIFAAATASDLAATARAPRELAALGAAALPVLQDKLQHGDERERRIAVLALLQLGPQAASLAPLLADTAAHDPDQNVRAAAEHAHRRATGDTSDLDRLRAADEAARRDR